MKNLAKSKMELIYGGGNGGGDDDGPSDLECGLAAVGCLGVALSFGAVFAPLGAIAGAGCYQAMEYGGC